MATDNLYGYFHAIAMQRRQDTAIELDDREISYGELLHLVHEAAGRLAETCAGKPARVGLLASRSLAAYAGYLAVLRLGAAVVPMNAHANAGRNVAIGREAGLDAVIVDASASHLRARFSAELGVRILDLTGLQDYASPAGSPARYHDGTAVRPDDIAYIAFTSGSTGRPKGVPVSHGNVLSFVTHAARRYGFSQSSRIGQVFDFSFDSAVIELWCTWATGGTVCVIPPEDVLFPDSFVKKFRLTHLIALPSMMGFALREGLLAPGSFPLLRHILMGGEPVTQAHAAAMALAAPYAALYNCYGPTELTVLCASYAIGADSASWPPTANGTVPIGAIYPHLEYRVVDDAFQISDDGELCVRGPQRFAGYLDSAHNDGRFLRTDGAVLTPCDGSSPVAGDYWYRTGDRVREEGGLLVHMGRIDTQVKIGGLRVELGEIESVVRSHREVMEAIAVVTADDEAGSTVHLFYTGVPVPAGELSGIVSDLPPHMRPAQYHYCAQIPLTLNGKADRNRLATELAALSTAERQS